MANSQTFFPIIWRFGVIEEKKKEKESFAKMRKLAQNKTYWLPSACLVSETHIRWFASSITVSKLCSDIYGTPIPVVALPRSLNLHPIIIIEQAARIYFTLPIFRIVLLRYKFWKQNLRDVIKYVMLMINFTNIIKSSSATLKIFLLSIWQEKSRAGVWTFLKSNSLEIVLLESSLLY